MISKIRFISITLMALAVIGAGCATPQKKSVSPVTPKGQPSLNQLVLQAELYGKEKNLQKELAVYREMVRLYPTEKASAVAYYNIGQNYLSLRDYHPALRMFENLISLFPDSEYLADSLIGAGIAETYLKRYAEADSRLETALSKASSPRQKSTILYYLGESSYLSGKAMRAIDWFLECRNSAGPYKTQAERRIKLIMHSLLSEKDLLEIVNRFATRFPADMALVELAQYYKKNSDSRSLARIMEKLQKDFPGMAVPEEMAAITEKAVASDIITIGCVLPLSGKDAAIGSQALKGIQLAFSLNSQLVDSRHIRLMIKDSASDPNTTRTAIQELADDITVMGIIGPYTTETLDAAVDISAQYIMPLFTTAEATPEVRQAFPNARIFQAAITGKSQGGMLGELAAGTLGYRRLAILYPGNQYGRSLMEVFSSAVLAHGAELVAIQEYDPTATDFSEEIKALGGMNDNRLRNLIYDLITQEEGKTPEEINAILETTYQHELATPQITKWKEIPLTKDNFSCGLRINYDAIFIPGNYERAGLILPELAFYNISGIQVIGSDRYASAELVKIAGKYADGIIFTGEFFQESAREDIVNFLTSFERAFGHRPNNSAAKSYDAVNLFLKLIEDGVDTKTRFMESLRNLKSFRGVSGEFGTNAEDIFEKRPFLLTVSGEKIVEYHPKPLINQDAASSPVIPMEPSTIERSLETSPAARQ